MVDPWVPVARWQGARTIGRLAPVALPDVLAGVEAGGDPTATGREALVVVGDEVAGSAGCATAVLARGVAEGLARHSGGEVLWQVLAEPDGRARDVHFGVLNQLPTSGDVALLVVGLHDLLARTAVADFRVEVEAVLSRLSRCGFVLVCGVPWVERAPALGGGLASAALRRSMGGRRHELDAVLSELASAHRAGFVELWMDGGDFAPDGFTPSETAVARWAERVVEAI